MRRRPLLRFFDPLPALVIGTVLLVGGFVVALTRAPDAEIFVRAQSWPIVGGTIERLRTRYLAADLEAEAGPTGDLTGASLGERFEAPLPPLERFFVQPGVDLRRRPDASSELLYSTRALDQFELVAREGGWVLARSLTTGQAGWLDPAVPRDLTPPLGMEPLPPGPLAGRPPDGERLDEVIRILGPSRPRQLAGYELYSSGLRAALVESLETAIEGLEAAYASRWQLEFRGGPAEAIVLFPDEGQYREFQASEPRIANLRSEGHAAGGIVSTFVGPGRSDTQLLTTVIHEVTHLLNRRAIGPALPPWLDEGLAEELSLFGLEQLLAAGSVPVDSFERYRRQVPGGLEYSGPLANLQLLRIAIEAGSLDSLEWLTSLEWSEFVGGRDGARNYAYSSLWVRYLLVDPARRSAMQGFLQDVAGGAPPSADRLRARLGKGWLELDRSFRSWLFDEVARLRL